VVFFLIDAFGWRFFEKIPGRTLPAANHAPGQRYEIDLAIPSTTAAHVTTIHTGLPVGEHGIFGVVLLRTAPGQGDRPAAALVRRTPQRDTLNRPGLKPPSFYPTSTTLPTAQAPGRICHHFPAARVHPFHLLGPAV